MLHDTNPRIEELEISIRFWTFAQEGDIATLDDLAAKSAEEIGKMRLGHSVLAEARRLLDHYDRALAGEKPLSALPACLDDKLKFLRDRDLIGEPHPDILTRCVDATAAARVAQSLLERKRYVRSKDLIPILMDALEADIETVPGPHQTSERTIAEGNPRIDELKASTRFHLFARMGGIQTLDDLAGKSALELRSLHFRDKLLAEARSLLDGYGRSLVGEEAVAATPFMEQLRKLGEKGVLSKTQQTILALRVDEAAARRVAQSLFDRKRPVPQDKFGILLMEEFRLSLGLARRPGGMPRNIPAAKRQPT